jgi:hypothetical protein
MNFLQISFWLYVTAAFLLLCIGLFYLIFVPEKYQLCIFLFGGAFINAIFALKTYQKIK